MAERQDPFVNSLKNYELHQYLDRNRTLPLLQEQLTYASAGHLLETYVDALHVALLMDERSFLIRVRDAPDTIRNPTFIRASHRLPPAYVIEALGNYLESPSFFVKHIIGKPNEPARQDTKQPSSTQFAHEAHGQLRLNGIRYTEMVSFDYFPPRKMGDLLTRDQWMELRKQAPKEAVSSFRHAIEDYKQLLADFTKDYRIKHFSAQEGEKLARSSQMPPEHKKIIFDAFEASPQLTAFNARLEPIIAQLQKALSPPALEYIFVKVGDQTCQLNNSLLNPKFPNSTPALMLVALSFVGRHQIDRTFFPKQAFNFTLSIGGAESNISDNMELLNRRISQEFAAAGTPLTDDLLFSTESKDIFVNSINTHRRGIQLLHLFHKTAGLLEKIYPEGKHDVAYKDMEQLLSLVGSGHELEELARPEEAATLIFAIERRLRAQTKLGGKFYNAIGNLLNKAGHLGRKNHFSAAHPNLKQDILSGLKMIEEHDNIEHSHQRAILPAIYLVRRALEQK